MTRTAFQHTPPGSQSISFQNNTDTTSHAHSVDEYFILTNRIPIFLRLFFFLTSPGLTCGIWDLSFQLQHTKLLAVAGGV